MWVARSLVRYRGRVYRKGETVPADDPRLRRAFERMGRIVWVEDQPIPAAELEAEALDLTTMTRAALDEYAVSLGIDHAATLPRKSAVIEAIEDALTAPDADDTDDFDESTDTDADDADSDDSDNDDADDDDSDDDSDDEDT